MAVATRGLSKLPGFSKSPEVTSQPDVGSGSVSTARTELGKTRRVLFVVNLFYSFSLKKKKK